ncbi:DNA repair protein RadC [Salmonella enterica]|nr:DNA repair protein RadC [Salmonella enterica]EMD7797600.1 DNA repair protein RadC [Salmonella enterica]
MSEHTLPYFSSADKKLINRAISLFEEKYIVAETASSFTNSDTVINYLRLKFPDHDREHFLVLFLNNQHHPITCEVLFSGKINSVEVHTTVIARKALLHNAAAVILAHNHPSGNACPSEADKRVTANVCAGLSLLDIRVLDHIIIAPGGDDWSFAQYGQLPDQL